MDQFSGAPVTHPVLACAEEIESALMSVTEVDPGFVSVEEQRNALASLTGLGSLVEELRMRVVAASALVAAAEGSRDVAAWLVAHLRVDRPAAAAAQRLASGLRDRWTHTGAGVRSGGVSVPQAGPPGRWTGERVTWSV